MQEAIELRSQGIDVIDLGPGEPDFPTPHSIKQAGMEAIASDFTKYTPASGIKELRDSIAEEMNRKWGSDFSGANVIITCGAKHAIFNVCMSVFEKGDEVLIPSPYWVTFPEIVKMTGARPVNVETQENEGFVLKTSAVQERLNAKTRGLIVNTPNNPTGALLPSQTLKKLKEIAESEDLFLIFDETYEYLTYEGKRHSSIASFVNSSSDDFALVGSFSKTYSMTGWRIGYCVGPVELIGKMGQLQSHQTGNPNSMSQKAAVTALAGGTKDLEIMRNEYEKRRRIVLEEISRIPGFRCTPPYGAFYAFPNVSGAMEDLGMTTSQEFCRFLTQRARVATVPGSAFGMEGHIRISYATTIENLLESFRRIREALSSSPPL